MALLGGRSMSEHENPGEATLFVLRGRVRLIADDDVWDGRSGDMIVIPDSRHSLEAVEDSVVLLTVAKL
jgi:quercetin dioxygenase-like cupin family protein